MAVIHSEWRGGRFSAQKSAKKAKLKVKKPQEMTKTLFKHCKDMSEGFTHQKKHLLPVLQQFQSSESTSLKGWEQLCNA